MSCIFLAVSDQQQTPTTATPSENRKHRTHIFRGFFLPLEIGTADMLEKAEMADSGREDRLPLLSTDTVVKKTNYAKNIHILSGTVFLILLAYHGAQNLESSLDSGNDLGTTSLGVHYVSFALFSLLATPFVRSYGPWNSLILGTTGYWLFICSNIFPSWYTMVPAGLYMGFTNAIFWVGQGTYLTSHARSHAIAHDLPEATVLGSFNGEFFGAFACTQVVGNFISLGLLRTDMGGNAAGTTLLFPIYLGIVTAGVILACFLSKQCDSNSRVKSPSAAAESTTRELLIATFSPLLDKRMFFLIPLLMYSGLEQAFVWAKFTKDIVSFSIGVQWVGGAMAVLGATGATFSLLSGRLTHNLQSITIMTSAAMVCQAIVLLRLWLNHSFGRTVGGVVNILSVAALWGVGDGVLNTQINATLALLFPGDTEAIFSQLKLWQSGAIAVIFFVSPHVTFTTMLLVLAATLFVSFSGFLILTLFLSQTLLKKMLM